MYRREAWPVSGIVEYHLTLTLLPAGLWLPKLTEIATVYDCVGMCTYVSVCVCVCACASVCVCVCVCLCADKSLCATFSSKQPQNTP